MAYVVLAYILLAKVVLAAIPHIADQMKTAINLVAVAVALSLN